MIDLSHDGSMGRIVYFYFHLSINKASNHSRIIGWIRGRGVWSFWYIFGGKTTRKSNELIPKMVILKRSDLFQTIILGIQPLVFGSVPFYVGKSLKTSPLRLCENCEGRLFLNTGNGEAQTICWFFPCSSVSATMLIYSIYISHVF